MFEGHSHYVMQVVFNPKDTNTFASASLDRTVKVGAGSFRSHIGQREAQKCQLLAYTAAN